MLHASPPSRSRLSSSIACCLVLVAVALLACKKGEGSECYGNDKCKDGMVCLNQPSSASKCTDRVKALADCAARDGCKRYGNCAIWVDDNVTVCAPMLEVHCKSSTECAEKGTCKLDETKHQCVAGGSAPAGTPAAKEADPGGW